jgi:hypothetical protein
MEEIKTSKTISTDSETPQLTCIRLSLALNKLSTRPSSSAETQRLLSGIIATGIALLQGMLRYPYKYSDSVYELSALTIHACNEGLEKECIALVTLIKKELEVCLKV